MNAPQACLAVALLALAGCLAEPSRPPAPPPPRPPAEVALTDDLFLLPACRRLVVSLWQERGAASQGVPPGYELAEGDLVTLRLEAFECDSLVLGNRSVTAPFRWARVAHFVDPAAPQAVEADVLLREMLVPDAALAARLAGFGLPAVHAQVDVAFDATSWTLAVAAPGLRYDASGAMSPLDRVSTDQRRQESAVAAGAGGRLAWMHQDIHQTEDWSGTMPALVQAGGGYLGEALPGGAQPARATLRAESMSATFADGDGTPG